MTISLFLLLSLGPVLSPPEEAPNIVLILGDDQAWTDYGFMGHPVIRTPGLDRLASEGLVYTRGYVPSSLCRPSLASIITGLYPHEHGITGNDPLRNPGESQEEYLRKNDSLKAKIEEHSTLPRILGEMGYVSFQSGKWWEGSYRQGGFTRGMTHGDPSRGGRHGDEGLKIGREGLEPIRQFLRETRPEPFFLWYAPFLPHTPHNPPERLLQKYRASDRSEEMARYCAMCEWFDETVTALVESLEEFRLLENTLIIFVADNGWIQRTPDTPVPSGWEFDFAPASKRSPNEGGLRTPLILYWRNRIQPGKSKVPVSSIDIFPTVLQAVGATVPAGRSGVNLLDSDGISARNQVFGALFTHDVADIHDPVKSLKFRWIVERGWKLIVPHAPVSLDSRIQLYDVVADPGETKNMADTFPGLTRRMLGSINEWWEVR